MRWKALFWLGVYVAIYLASFINIKLSGFWGFVSTLLGVVLFIYAFTLAGVAGRTLKYYAHKVRGQSFIPDKFTALGIYSCMRHPMHLGIGLLPLSLALIFGNVGAILASGWGLAAAFWFILVIEEPEVIESFKDDYIEYLKTTPAISFKPSCLSKGLKLLIKSNPKEAIQENSKVEVTGFEAKYYDRLMDIITFGWYPKFISKAIEAIGIKNGDKIIDFGAGTGRNALLMQKYIGKDGKITGVEIGKEMQEQFLAKTKEHKNIELLNKSIIEEFEEKGTYDKAFISFVLHGFTQENREKIINNAYNLLNENGEFAILDYNEFNVDKAPLYMQFAMRKVECPLAEDFVNRDLKEMLKEAGFKEFKEELFFKGYLRLLVAKK